MPDREISMRTLRTTSSLLPDAAAAISAERNLAAPRHPLFLLATLLLAFVAVRAEAGVFQWNNGSIGYTSHNECINSTVEQLTAQYVGYWGMNDASAPAVGDVYYAHIVISTIGNSCAAPFVVPEVLLPPNTNFAVSASNPVRCFYGPIAGSMTEITGVTNPNTGYPFCQNPFAGTYGYGLSFGAQLPQGKSFEFWFPLASSTTLSGIADSSYLTGYVHTVADVDSWSTSQEGVFVAAAASPDVYYINPTTTNLTSSSVRLLASVDNRYTSGIAYFDWGLTTGYASSTPANDSIALSNLYSSFSLYDDLSGLTPGTTYHWRIRYVTSGNVTYAGADQTFATPAVGATIPSILTQPAALSAWTKTAFTLQAGASGSPTPTVQWQISNNLGQSWNNIGGATATSLTTIAAPLLNNVWYRAVFSNSAGSTATDAAVLKVQGLGTAWHGDFDGDGKSDILWHNMATGASTIWKSGLSSSLLAVSSLTDLAWHVVAIADFNGDGKADIFWRNSRTGANTIWLSANSSTRQAVTSITDQAWAVVGADDFDGDGKDDVLWRNIGTGANAIWKSGNSATRQSVTSVTNLAWKIVGTGDFNNDGKADILWRDISTGKNVIWKSGMYTTQQTVTGVSDLAWQVAAVADYNADGKADILWRHTSTGANAIWLSASAATKQAVTGITDLAWKIAGAGDYDADGKADILWRNSTTGANTIWKSANSATRQSVNTLSAIWVVAM
jgi:hypothetical protein